MSHSCEYETVCVFEPHPAGDQIAKVEEKMRKVIATHKGSDIVKKDWGLRPLAYQIQKHSSGQYIQYNFKANTSVVAELEKTLGYEESLLRFLTVRMDKATPKNVLVEPKGFDSYDY